MLILSKTLSVVLFLVRLYTVAPEIALFRGGNKQLFVGLSSEARRTGWGSQEGCFEKQMTLPSSCC